MAKVDYRRLPIDVRRAQLHLLMRTLATCGLGEEGQQFLSDLLMESEITMLARRIAIARHLILGWPFRQIQRKLQVGLQNIASVDRWLSENMYEYRVIVCVKRQIQPEVCNPYSFRALCKKYPGRSVLINLLLGEVDVRGHD